MTKEHFHHLTSEPFPKLVKFIENLLRQAIPITHIDTNAWEDSSLPSVYVHNRKHMFQMKRYSRCSNYDIKQAVKFYLKEL